MIAVTTEAPHTPEAGSTVVGIAIEQACGSKRLGRARAETIRGAGSTPLRVPAPNAEAAVAVAWCVAKTG